MKINKYTKTVIAPRATPQLTNPYAVQQASQAAFGVAAVTDVGAQVAKSYEDAENLTWVNKAIIESKKYKIREMDTRANDPNFVPKDFPDRFSEDLKKYNNEYAKTAPTEEARQLYMQKMEELDLGFYEDSITLSRKKFVEQETKNLKTRGEDLAEIAYANTLNGRSNADIRKDADATTVSAGSIVGFGDLPELNKELHKSIDEAELRALQDSNPEEALKRVEMQLGNIDFDTAVDEVLRLEGGFVENDAGAGPTIFGVNSTHNPKEYEQIKKLADEGKTEEAISLAKDTYKKKYWDAIGADNLPPKLALVAFDAAVNQGQGAAKKMLEEADGSLSKFIQLRRERYLKTAQNPKKAPNLKGWLNRLDEMKELTKEPNLSAEELVEYRDGTIKIMASNDAQATKILKEKQALSQSRFDLALAMAGTQEELSAVSRQVDDLQPILGEEWANDARTKIVKAADDYIKKQESVTMGAVFASGEATPNPNDTEHKKALDNYYDSLSKSEIFSQLPVEEKNSIIADVITNSRMVPDRLKGEISSAAKSQDAETIKQVANLKDAIVVRNPYLANSLGSETDLRRIDMINARLDAGVTAKEAISNVDNILDPKNAPNEEQVKKELAEAKIDYRDQVVKSFRTTGDWFAGFVGGGLEQEAPMAKAQIDAAALEYRVIYEDVYRKTRDGTQAEKEAKQKMSLWGRSEINNQPMIMKYPIEDYYSIENESSEWIRKQAIQDISEFSKSSLLPRDEEFIKENMFIVPHPTRTAETAALGEPEYSVIMMIDGVPLNYLGEGKYWKPDVQKRKEQLTKETRPPRTMTEIAERKKYSTKPLYVK